MFSRIDALATFSVVLLIIGFLGSTYFLSIDYKTGNIGGLNSASVRSLGRVNAVSWQNWREYVFIYDCLKDAGSPDPNCLDGMRILEVMTLMTYRGRVYAVIAPVGEIWSFDGENWTVAFVWDKMVHNPGQYTLSYCELCLVFKRGRIPKPRGARNIKQLVRIPRGKHSEKPSEIRISIEAMFPTQDKIELFARHKPNGWDVWGLDVREEYAEDSSEHNYIAGSENNSSQARQQLLF